MANKKKQFDQEFKQNAVNYCLTHPELSRNQRAIWRKPRRKY